MFETDVVLADLEVVGPVLEVIAFDWFLTVQRFNEFVEVEVTNFWFFLSLHESIVLEVSDSVEEGDLRDDICTPILLFLPDREF